MAVVYLAKHELLDRKVALKVLLFGASDPTFKDSFIKEGRIVATLKHPNIVDIYDIGIEDDRFYMVMEFIEGGTLKQLLNKTTMNVSDILRVIEQMATALSYAHKEGYVHRDVKPENILLREDGTCVLADFGIAKLQGTDSALTQMGYKTGTPNYMSPEQVMSEVIDTRSDIYSLGVVLYEMLTGEQLFQGKNTISVSYKHVHEKVPTLPTAYHHFQPILDKVLAKRKEGRFADVRDFSGALSAAHKQMQRNDGESKDNEDDKGSKDNKESSTTAASSLPLAKADVTDSDALVATVVTRPKNYKIRNQWFKGTLVGILLIVLGGAYYLFNGKKQQNTEQSTFTHASKIDPLINTHQQDVNKKTLDSLDDKPKDDSKIVVSTTKKDQEKIEAERVTSKEAEAKRVEAEKVVARELEAKKAKAEKVAARKLEEKKAKTEKVAARKLEAKEEAITKKKTKKESTNIVDKFLQNEKNAKRKYQQKWKREQEQRRRAYVAAQNKKKIAVRKTTINDNKEDEEDFMTGDDEW